MSEVSSGDLPTHTGQSHSPCPGTMSAQSSGGQWLEISICPALQYTVTFGAGQCFSPSLSTTPFSTTHSGAGVGAMAAGCSTTLSGISAHTKKAQSNIKGALGE